MKSQRLIIEGGNALSGEIKVQGAKNSSLPIIAASLMCKGETVLKNCPCLTAVSYTHLKKKDTESVPKLIIMQMQLKLNRTEQASGTVITENHSLLI